MKLPNFKLFITHDGWVIYPSKMDFTWKSEILSLAVGCDTVGRSVSCRSCWLIINLNLYSSTLSGSEFHRWQHKICQRERMNYRWAVFAYSPPLFFTIKALCKCKCQCNTHTHTPVHLLLMLL